MNGSGGPPSIQAQHEYYNDRWANFEYANQLELTRIAAALQFMTRIDLPAKPKICDFGCGPGWSTNILGMFGPTTGVDLADITAAQARYPQCKFVSADALEWDAPKSEFDVVVNLEVLEHIEAVSHDKFIRRIHEILKQQGHLILTTPNKSTMNAIRGGGRSWSNQPIEEWVSARELRSLLERNGFKVLSMTSVVLGIADLGWYRLVNSPKVNACLAFAGLRKIWQKTALWADFGLHLVALAQKK
jgi:SAM-dependent methyltransferase